MKYCIAAYLNAPYEDYKHLNGMQNGFGNQGGGGGGSSYVNEVLNPVEDHYNHQVARPAKSVGWAEDNLIQPVAHNYQEPIEHRAPDILTENGYGMMGPPHQPDGFLYNGGGGNQQDQYYNMQVQQYHDQQQLYNLGVGGAPVGSGRTTYFYFTILAIYIGLD